MKCVVTGGSDMIIKARQRHSGADHAEMNTENFIEAEFGRYKLCHLTRSSVLWLYDLAIQCWPLCLGLRRTLNYSHVKCLLAAENGPSCGHSDTSLWTDPARTRTNLKYRRELVVVHRRNEINRGEWQHAADIDRTAGPILHTRCKCSNQEKRKREIKAAPSAHFIGCLKRPAVTSEFQVVVAPPN